MRERSGATVTFLFTDIEGSTDLLKSLREAYEDLLMEHRRLLEGVFEEAGGRVIDTQGDAFFVAFRTAHAAVAAAAQAQRALNSHAWPQGVVPRVRMGIHTGEPSVVEEQFVGLAVHRAARICAAGHGGQVLLSSTTRDLVEDRLPPGLRLVDLGEHRLKDIERPERIAQVVIEGLPPVFTPLKGLDAQSAAAPRFAGHEEQLAGAAQAAVGAAADRRVLLASQLKVALLKLRLLLGSKTLPGARRSRPQAMEAIGLRLHAASRIAPDDLRMDLAKLGSALTKAARAAADADRLLAESDPRTLSRQLRDYREVKAATERHVQAADAVAKRLSAVEALQELRDRFEGQAAELEDRLEPLPGKIFQARLDRSVPADLEAEVRELGEAVDELASALRDACDRLQRELAAKRRST